MFDGFYSGKRVFITGHTGFKGAWLCLWLKKLGAIVHGYSLESPSEPNLHTLAGNDSSVDSTFADIRDLETLSKAMSGFAPDIVIHMAAQSLVRQSYSEPVDTFSTNVLGTVNVLEACRRSPNVKAVINVTSDKCYENREWSRGYTENDRMGGHDPYSASKGCAELVASSYGRSFFHEGDTLLASVRAGNVIGGGDFADDRLIPDMARAFSAGKPVHIRSPKATRPWQHVLEPLSGYLLLAMKLHEEGRQFTGGWNFGPIDGDVRNVGEVVKKFASLWNGEAVTQIDDNDHPHEAGFLKLDCTKAATKLNWAPKTAFEAAIEWSCEWYSAWAKGDQDLHALTISQIDRYMEL